MINLRYIELSKPLHQALKELPPKAKRLLSFMEAGMLTVLFASLILYI